MNPQNTTDRIYPFPYTNQRNCSVDTIAAIATPPGKGGIGIIRISGDKALETGRTIFRKKNGSGQTVFPIQSHRIYYGKIVDPEKKEDIDEVMLCAMIAPRSYTREDVVEIQSHSGSAVLAKILELVLKQGIRIAEPGEFTKRAFLNGRIDLTQAEAVIDIINAENERARIMASRQLAGALKERLIHIKSKIIEALVQIEAEIDFSEDQEESFIDADFWQDHILSPLKRLKESAELGKIFKEGMNIVLAGKPNVGKSSVMNRLLQRERAIVTPFPGTTRDHIEASVNISEFNAVIIDTAGIHKSRDPIETIGIRKTWEMIQGADLVLFVCDISNDISREDMDIFDGIRDKKKIIVFNKKDLVDTHYSPSVPADWEKETRINISALQNHGLNQLKELVAGQVAGKRPFGENDILLSNMRQKNNIEDASMAVENAVTCHEHGAPLEIIAIEFKDALQHINNALGVELSDDILDRIFRNFCIGK